MDEKNILLSGVSDLFGLCEKRGSSVFSCFYDAAEQAEINRARVLCGECGFWGGHEECERKILGVFPEWEEIDFSCYPIRAIRISHTYSRELSHRDYLGSIMGLGVERNRIGDIFVFEKYAVCFVHESISEYLLGGISKIGSVGVKVCDITGEKIKPPVKKTRQISAVCASERLDAVLSAITGESRSKVSSLISHERVSINHEIVCDMSKKTAEGDLISVKGYGRFLICSFGSKTRSNRIHIEAQKFI